VSVQVAEPETRGETIYSINENAAFPLVFSFRRRFDAAVFTSRRIGSVARGRSLRRRSNIAVTDIAVIFSKSPEKYSLSGADTRYTRARTHTYILRVNMLKEYLRRFVYRSRSNNGEKIVFDN